MPLQHQRCRPYPLDRPYWRIGAALIFGYCAEYLGQGIACAEVWDGAIVSLFCLRV